LICNTKKSRGEGAESRGKLKGTTVIKGETKCAEEGGLHQGEMKASISQGDRSPQGKRGGINPNASGEKKAEKTGDARAGRDIARIKKNQITPAHPTRRNCL